MVFLTSTSVLFCGCRWFEMYFITAPSLHWFKVYFITAPRLDWFKIDSISFVLENIVLNEYACDSCRWTLNNRQSCTIYWKCCNIKNKSSISRFYLLILVNSLWFSTSEITGPNLKKKANFKHNYNEKLIKLTGLIRHLLTRGNRTNAKVTDWLVDWYKYYVFFFCFFQFLIDDSIYYIPVYCTQMLQVAFVSGILSCFVSDQFVSLQVFISYIVISSV